MEQRIEVKDGTAIEFEYILKGQDGVSLHSSGYYYPIVAVVINDDCIVLEIDPHNSSCTPLTK